MLIARSRSQKTAHPMPPRICHSSKDPFTVMETSSGTRSASVMCLQEMAPESSSGWHSCLSPDCLAIIWTIHALLSVHLCSKTAAQSKKGNTVRWENGRKDITILRLYMFSPFFSYTWRWLYLVRVCSPVWKGMYSDSSVFERWQKGVLRSNRGGCVAVLQSRCIKVSEGTLWAYEGVERNVPSNRGEATDELLQPELLPPMLAAEIGAVPLVRGTHSSSRENGRTREKHTCTNGA